MGSWILEGHEKLPHFIILMVESNVCLLQTMAGLGLIFEIRAVKGDLNL